MKKLTSILVLIFGFMATKAQTPKVVIKYDENGNRILRYFTPYRPGAQQPSSDSISVFNNNEHKDIAISDLASIEDNELKVYPNPSNDNFNIRISENILNNDVELVLIDQLGREHQRRKVKALITTISTKGMADGVYSIVVQYGNNRSTLRVAKVNK